MCDTNCQCFVCSCHTRIIGTLAMKYSGCRSRIVAKDAQRTTICRCDRFLTMSITLPPTQDSTCHSLILRSVCASVAVAYSQHQQCLLRTDTVFCKMQSPTASCMWCLLSVAICITQRTSHNFNYLDICCSLSTGLFDYVANHIMCCDSVVAAKCWYLSKVAFCIIFKNLLSSWHYVPKWNTQIILPNICFSTFISGPKKVFNSF